MFGSNFLNLSNNPNQQQQQQQQQAQPSSGGLFGGGGTTGGLFGGMNPMNQPQQSTTQTGGGLWGGASTGMTQTKMGGGGGLFGQPSTTQQGTGMIGSGLFQSKQPTQPTQTTQTGGLFGSSYPQQQTSTGLVPTTGTGLFGGGGIGSTGIFGGQQGQQTVQQPQQTGFGLFPQQGQTQQGQQQGLFQGAQGTTTGGSFFSGGFGQTPQTGTTQQGMGQSSFMGQGLGQGLGQTMGQGFGQTAGGGLGQTTTTPQTGGLFSSGTGIFGSSGMMGNQQQQQQQGSFTGSGLMSTNQPTVTTGSHTISYHPTKIQEQSNVGGQTKLDTIYLYTITAMAEFSKKSLEELRYEDFSNKKMGIVTKPSFTPGMTTSSGTSGLFQQPQPSTTTGTGFAQKSLFAPSSQTGTTQTGSSSGFGLTSTGGGLFKQPISGTTTTGGLFPSSGSSTFPQQQQQGGSTGLFTGTGTRGMFSSQSTSAQPSGGLFKQPQATSTGGGMFSSLGPTSQPQQQQQTGGGLFQSSILSPNKPTTSTGGLFAQPTQTGSMAQQPQQTGGGLFSSSTGTGSLFSGTGGGLTGGLTGGMTGGGQQTQGIQQTSSAASSLFGTGGAKPQTGGLFASTTTSTQPTTSGSLFSGLSGSSAGLTQAPQGLFATTAPQSSFGGMSFGPTSTGTTSGAASTSQPPMFNWESTTYKNFVDSFLTKQKNITDILNDLQRQYLEQDFFLEEYSKREKERRDVNLGESKYSYVPIYPEKELYGGTYGPGGYKYHPEYDYKHRVDPYESFLKSKRPYAPYSYSKYYESDSKPFYKEKDLRESDNKKKKSLLDFEFKNLKPEREESFKEKKEEDKVLKKSHSMDTIKQKEKLVVSNLEKSFDQKVNLEDDYSQMRPKKISDNVLFDLQISLQEPVKTTFKLKINKNHKVTMLKFAIVDCLKEKYPQLFKKLTSNSFVLMKKYSIIKDSSSLSECDIKDGDIIHVLLKESFNSGSNASSSSGVKGNEPKSKSDLSQLGSASSMRKESKTDKKKKKNKGELAPLEKLPSLTKSDYKTIPDFRNIARMTLEELENVDNFSIYNAYGRIDFEGKTDLTNLNLDQIVNISDKRITVYQNGDVDFKPPVGQGLNKPALLHLYNCFPNNEGKSITDEQLGLYLASLQKICKEKGAEFKSYDKNTGEWIFKVDHFV